MPTTTSPPRWSDWCHSLVITVTTFLLLACPIALTCVPSELVRLESLGKKRIIGCLLTPDREEAIVVVVGYADSKDASQGSAHDLTRCERKVVACNLKAQTARSRVLMEYPCLNCWAWMDPFGALVMSNDRGQLLSFQVGSPQTAPKPLLETAVLYDLQVSLKHDYYLINDDNQLSLYASGERHQIGLLVWTSPANVEAFALLPQSNGVVVARSSGELHQLFLVEPTTGRELRILFSLPYKVDKMIVLPNTKQLCVVCGQRVGLLPLDTPTVTDEPFLLSWLNKGVSDLVAVAPNEQTLVTTGPDSSRLIAWDISDRKPSMTFSPCDAILLGAEFLDDRRLVTWGTDNKLRIWNLNSPQVEREICL